MDEFIKKRRRNIVLTILGIIVGLLIVGGVLFLNNDSKKIDDSKENIVEEEPDNETIEEDLSFYINSKRTEKITTLNERVRLYAEEINSGTDEVVISGYGGYYIAEDENVSYLKRNQKIVAKLEKKNTFVIYKDETDKDSKYFKSEFEVLKGILNSEEVDVEKYTSQVAKMYVIDLYTLSTKVNKYDIGGVEYFHKDKKEMFEQKVMDTLYSTLLDNTYGDRIQELPEVTNVEVLSNEKSTYKLGKEDKEVYVIKLNITYDKDLGYDKEATVTLCQDSDVRWSVVDYQPVIK